MIDSGSICVPGHGISGGVAGLWPKVDVCIDGLRDRDQFGSVKFLKHSLLDAKSSWRDAGGSGIEGEIVDPPCRKAPADAP